MSTHHRLASLLTAAAVAVTGTALVTGHAATLQIDGAKLDTFAADQPAPTSTTTTAPAGDTQAPQVTTLQMFDTDTNGRVDQVIATFDETLAPYTAGTSPWTLANVPSGGSLASVTVAGTTATLTITEGTSGQDTAVGLFTVALSQNAAGIRDAVGNRSQFAATSPVDKARPMPLSMAIANGGSSAGKPEQGDKVTVVWSERLLPSSICTSGFSDTAPQTFSANLNSDTYVEIKDHAASPPSATDELTAAFSCGSFHFGRVVLGSAGYVTGTSRFGDNANNDDIRRASATWAPATATFSLSLGKAPTPSTTGTVGTSVTAVYTPDPLLTDLAGNAATGTVSATGVQF